MIWLDEYERRARLAPGLLALAPVIFAVVALGLRAIPVVSVTAAVLTAAGGPILLAGFVRRRGLLVQRRLWQQWDGAPTTAALRHESNFATVAQRDRWRGAVEAATGLRLPSAAEEATDPVGAQASIEMAVGELRELARGSESPLVAAENKNYGFQRNLLGMRAVGVAIAAVCVSILVAAWAGHQAGHVPHVQPAGIVAGLCIDVVLLVIWIFAPSAEATREAADKYAYQLMQAAVLLLPPSTRESSA